MFLLIILSIPFLEHGDSFPPSGRLLWSLAFSYSQLQLIAPVYDAWSTVLQYEKLVRPSMLWGWRCNLPSRVKYCVTNFLAELKGLLHEPHIFQLFLTIWLLSLGSSQRNDCGHVRASEALFPSNFDNRCSKKTFVNILAGKQDPGVIINPLQTQRT